MEKPLVGNAEAAAYAGVSESTWTAYRARDKAPAPDRREVSGGYARPVWERATLDAWKASRPGQGKGGGAGKHKPVERSQD